MFSEFSDSRKVLGACFKSKYAFVTCGVNHVYFWQKDQAGGYVKKVRCVRVRAALVLALHGVAWPTAMTVTATMAGGKPTANGQA